MKFKSFYEYAGSLDARVQTWLERNHNIKLEHVKVKPVGDRVLMTIFYTENS